MNTSTLTSSAVATEAAAPVLDIESPHASTSWARVADYIELTKPRIALLVLITVAVGAAVAQGGMPPAAVLFNVLLGTALVAASASALNQWIERASDARMQRTAERPLPAGRLAERDVIRFAVITALGGVGYLTLTVGPLTALFGLATWFTYAWIYTPLKSRTSLNTMVGAIAGALPIIMGWTSVGAPLNVGAWTLFVIVYLWQFPHFMAIAWLYRRQYEAAGMQMLTVVDPSGRAAGLQAVVAACVLFPVSLLPAAMRLAGLGYLAGSVVLGLVYLLLSVRFMRRLDEASARSLLRFSVLYLPMLMGMLMAAPLAWNAE
ncbi:MAG: heme o synthase [Pirellulales bacterium]|nr:heme o synthase [Pirellulales bacterium]